MDEQRVSYKIYYEDTDSLGVVYYANYLKYLERGRTEYIGQLGRDIRAWNQAGYYFVVYAMNIRFRKPAELGDWIEVVSALSQSSAYRGIFKQRIERGGELLVDAEVEIVCLGKERVMIEFPDVQATKF
jgi:tol-pal system-associated acyl-CoA thioesterase